MKNVSSSKRHLCSILIVVCVNNQSSINAPEIGYVRHELTGICGAACLGNNLKYVVWAFPF